MNELEAIRELRAANADLKDRITEFEKDNERLKDLVCSTLIEKCKQFEALKATEKDRDMWKAQLEESAKAHGFTMIERDELKQQLYRMTLANEELRRKLKAYIDRDNNAITGEGVVIWFNGDGRLVVPKELIGKEVEWAVRVKE